MTSIWLLLITMASIGCVAIIVFTSAAKRYTSKAKVNEPWHPFKHHDVKLYERRKNSKPIYYPFTDSEGNLVTTDRRTHQDRRHIP